MATINALDNKTEVSNFTIATGNLALSATNSALTTGVINVNAARFMHSFGTANTFLGETAGNGSLTVATSKFNVGVGYASLKALTSGTYNASLGGNSCQALTTGNNNVAVGLSSLYNMTQGGSNVAIGQSAGSNIVTGNYNIILGKEAGLSLTLADSNNIIVGNSGTVGDVNKIIIGTAGSGAGQQNKCYIAGISGVAVAGGSPVVIDSNGQLGTGTGGAKWSVVTVDAGLVINTGTIANKAGLLTMTLPATAAIGDELAFTGINTAVGLRIAQNANQQIFFGLSNTTAGVGGYLETTAIRDSLRMVCVVAGASTIWNVTSSTGNWTIV